MDLALPVAGCCEDEVDQGIRRPEGLEGRQMRPGLRLDQESAGAREIPTSLAEPDAIRRADVDDRTDRRTPGNAFQGALHRPVQPGPADGLSRDSDRDGSQSANHIGLRRMSCHSAMMSQM